MQLHSNSQLLANLTRLMETKLIVSLVFILLEVASAVPIDNSRDDVYIPPLIRNIFHKMSAVMDQGDLDISLKYLRIVKTLHWLEPVTCGKYLAKYSGNWLLTSLSKHEN